MWCSNFNFSNFGKSTKLKVAMLKNVGETAEELECMGTSCLHRNCTTIAQELHKKMKKKNCTELHLCFQAVWSSSGRFHCCALCNARRCYLYYLHFVIHGFVQVQISGMSIYLLLDLFRLFLYVSLKILDDILEYSEIFVNITDLLDVAHFFEKRGRCLQNGGSQPNWHKSWKTFHENEISKFNLICFVFLFLHGKSYEIIRSETKDKIYIISYSSNILLWSFPAIWAVLSKYKYEQVICDNDWSFHQYKFGWK